jgi:hypothetical protein
MHKKTILHFDELTLSYLLDNPSTSANILSNLREKRRLKTDDERILFDEETEVKISLKKRSHVIKLTIDENQPSNLKQEAPTISMAFFAPHKKLSFPGCDGEIKCDCDDRWYETTETVLSSKAEMIAKMESMIDSTSYVEVDSYDIFRTKHFQGMPIDEEEDLDLVCKKAAFVKKHGALGVAVFIHCEDLDHAARYLNENYEGSWDSKEAFAQHRWYDMCTMIYKKLSDADTIYQPSFCEDIFQKYFFSVVVCGKVHVFGKTLSISFSEHASS